MREHGGTFRLVNGPAGGTKVTVSVPLAPMAQSSAGSRPALPAAHAGQTTRVPG
jgi:hypothetical protein